MASALRQDYEFLASVRGKRSLAFLISSVLFDNGFQAVLFYRLARWFKEAGIPVVPVFLWRQGLFLTGADINPNAELGPGLMISHGVGLVVGGGVVTGERVLLHHEVTLGAPTSERIGAVPRIGNDVVIGAGAKVIGAVTVGDGAFLGANVLITEDVPAGCKVTVPPTPIPSG